MEQIQVFLAWGKPGWSLGKVGQSSRRSEVCNISIFEIDLNAERLLPQKNRSSWFQSVLGQDKCLPGSCCATLAFMSPMVSVQAAHWKCRAWAYEHQSFQCLEGSGHVYKLWAIAGCCPADTWIPLCPASGWAPGLWGQQAASGVHRHGTGTAPAVLKIGVHLGGEPRNSFFISTSVLTSCLALSNIYLTSNHFSDCCVTIQ